MNFDFIPFSLQKSWGIHDDVLSIGDTQIALDDVEKVWGFKSGRVGVGFSLRANGKPYILSAAAKKGDEQNVSNAEAVYHFIEDYISNKQKAKFVTCRYKRCDACGRVFKISEAQLDYAERRTASAAKDATLGRISSASSFSSGLFGAYVGKNLQEQAEKKLDEALSIWNCPYCKSDMTFDISENDFNTLEQQQSYKNQPVAAAPVSAADEIKKFKELLDIGAITQEEFDAKKKQLLGL